QAHIQALHGHGLIAEVVALFVYLQRPLVILFLFYSHRDHRDLHSFPTRRSSDLLRKGVKFHNGEPFDASAVKFTIERALLKDSADRKSTRLNSSHRTISYAVFCLKKKRKRSSSSRR